MAPSSSLIVCKSVHHGNTAKVAKAIAGELGAKITAPEAVPYTSISGRPIVGFGSGVYYGRMHEAICEWPQGVPDAAEDDRCEAS